MSRVLAGSCQVPLGGFAEVQAGKLRMRGFVASPDGKRMVRADLTGEIADPEALGKRVAEALLARRGRNSCRPEWLSNRLPG